MSRGAVVFESVTFERDGRAVLSDFSLEVRRGETLALLGRSGSGKTTALKLVNRLLTPSQGRILVEGADIAEIDPIQLRRSIGYVIQEGGLLPHRTVSANAGLVPELSGWTAARIAARVRELLEIVGLPPDDYGGRYPHQLSGGQRQRVGIARALAADPPLLLLDEPFGALDPITRVEMQDEFLRLREAFHKTALFVTHDVTEAMRVATRIAVLSDGSLEFAGTPEEFRAATGDAARLLRAARP